MAFNKLFGKKNKENTETSLIEQFYYPKYGPGQLWETLAEKVENMGGKVLKEHKVEKLNFKNGKLVSVSCNKNGQEEIIEGDKIEELQKLIREKGINAISPIKKSFNEIQKVEIPIIHECIIKKASKCFKFLLLNEIIFLIIRYSHSQRVQNHITINHFCNQIIAVNIQNHNDHRMSHALHTKS